jgi:predicted MPP superfamily phosphohydrolase
MEPWIFATFKHLLHTPPGRAINRAVEAWATATGQMDIATVTIPLVLARLPVSFGTLRLVHLSDFHLSTWLTAARLEAVIDRVNDLRPDVVALTGDFVTHSPAEFTPALTAALRRLPPNCVTVSVLGNHDHWTHPGLVQRALRAAGVIDLSNTVHTLTRPGGRLHLAGVDDVLVAADCLPEVRRRLPSDSAAILLAHEPDFAPTAAAAGRFDLQLSGHSHGGQICTPWGGALFLPRLGRRWPRGLSRLDGMWQYTSAGLGTGDLHLRLNCPAEITLFLISGGAAPGLIASDSPTSYNSPITKER